MADVAPTRQKVTVACKLPHGLVLELNGEKMEAPAPGAREVKVFFPIGEKVVINGSLANHPSTGRDGRVVAGFGLTDVDATFWDRWVAQNAGFPPLALGMLFAQPTQDRTQDKAKEFKTLKTGLEPLSADKPAPGLTRVVGGA